MSRKEKTSSIEDDINQNLKRIFDKVASEDLPPRLLKQLEELRARDSKASGSDSDAND